MMREEKTKYISFIFYLLIHFKNLLTDLQMSMENVLLLVGE